MLYYSIKEGTRPEMGIVSTLAMMSSKTHTLIRLDQRPGSHLTMKHTHHRRSDCPINFALETFGDPWSLLLIRDIVYFGKKTYSEFLESEEGIATNILASRLAHLEQKGILVKKPSEKEKRKEEYVLTEKGLSLIPVLVEMANWSAEHDPQTAAPAAWIALMKTEREKMIQLIHETVQSGGAVFAGEKSLVSQFM
jgi:DNA-binding HxlR family transcriptional regulator